MGVRVSTEVLTVVEHREPATRHVARSHQEVELVEVAEQLPCKEQPALAWLGFRVRVKVGV